MNTIVFRTHRLIMNKIVFKTHGQQIPHERYYVLVCHWWSFHYIPSLHIKLHPIIPFRLTVHANKKDKVFLPPILYWKSVFQQKTVLNTSAAELRLNSYVVPQGKCIKWFSKQKFRLFFLINGTMLESIKWRVARNIVSIQFWYLPPHSKMYITKSCLLPEHNRLYLFALFCSR